MKDCCKPRHHRHHRRRRHSSHEALPFTLVSTAFSNGGAIPLAYTQATGGNNYSPELSWYNAPSKTASFTLIVDDPTDTKVLGRPYINWIVYNISPTIPTTSAPVTSSNNNIPSASASNTTVTFALPAITAANDGVATISPHYAGPDPSDTTKHVYRFTLFALKNGLNTFPLPLNADEFECFQKDQILGKATLYGTFQTLSP